MRIAHIAATVIIDHDAVVEDMIFETAILPAFGLALEIVGEEADEFVDGGRCACRGGGGWTGYREGHIEKSVRDIVVERSELEPEPLQSW